MPKTPRLEKYTGEEEELLTKTPKVVRKKIAKGYLVIFWCTIFNFYIYLGIEHQNIEQLNEANDSDYSICDKSDESDSDDSTHSNIQRTQLEVPQNTNLSLRRSTRKKEISFVILFIT